MKKNFWFLLALSAIVMVACSDSKSVESTDAGETAAPTASSVAYAVNTDASSIQWVGKKVTGSQHAGTLAISGGEISVADGNIVSGNFTIDMTSLAVTDEMGEEMVGKLVGHLKSDDFFSVEANPAATFAITNVAAAAEGAEGTHSISGNLTIKGISKEITFPAQVSISEAGVNATANVTIDRTEWDVRYGSGKFFEDLGDKMISDDIDLSLNIQASAPSS